MARKIYNYDELTKIAIDLVRSLKPKGLTIGDLRYIFDCASKALDRITYGEPILEDEGNEN